MYCGESPESGSHIFDHTYVDPRPGVIVQQTQKWNDKAHLQLLTKEDVAESFGRARKADVIFKITRTRDTFELVCLSVVFIACLAAILTFLVFYP